MCNRNYVVTTTTILQPLWLTTCVSWHYENWRTFLKQFYCLHVLVDGNWHICPLSSMDALNQKKKAFCFKEVFRSRLF